MLPSGTFALVAMVALAVGQAVLSGPVLAIDVMAPMPVLAVVGLCALHPAHARRLDPVLLFMVGVASDLLSGVQIGTVPLVLLGLRFLIGGLHIRFGTMPAWCFRWVLGPVLTTLATAAVALVGIGLFEGAVSVEVLAFQVAAVLLLYPLIHQFLAVMQALFQTPARPNDVQQARPSTQL